MCSKTLSQRHVTFLLFQLLERLGNEDCLEWGARSQTR